MISQFEIRNFKCYKHWKQGGLKRFNFLVGESGVGKTAFLEALFMMGASNPEIWFRIRRWRGQGEGPIQLATRDNYESVFRDLFYQYNQREVASIGIWDSENGKRKLEVFYENQDVYTLPLKEFKQEERRNAFSINPIIFKWELRDRVQRSSVEIIDGNLRMTGGGEVYPCILVSQKSHSGREYAQYFSNLSRARKAGPVLGAMQDIFPKIRGISIEMLAGEPVVFCNVEGLDELIAIGDMSGGLERYLSLAVSILTNRNGAVLVDEFETGFYYRNLPAIMTGIIKLCDLCNVQLFATTHSYELLKTVAQTMGSAQKGAKEFCILRLEKGESTQPDITLIEGESSQFALENDSEIR